MLTYRNYLKFGPKGRIFLKHRPVPLWQNASLYKKQEYGVKVEGDNTEFPHYL